MIELGSISRGNFYKQLWFTTALRAAGLIFGFISTFLITLILSPEEFGVFIFLSTIFGILSIITTFGYERAHIQVTSGVLSQDTIDRDVFAFHAIGTVCLVVSILIVALSWIGPLSVYGSLGDLVLISSITLVSLWLTKMAGAYWRAREDALRSEIVISAIGRIAPIPLVAILLLLDASVSGFGFLLLTSIVTTFFTIPFALTMLKSAFRGYGSAWAADIRTKAFSSSSHMLQIATTSIFDYMPIVVLGLMAMAVETGIYGIVIKIFIPVVILHQIVAVSFFPKVASALRSGSLDAQISAGLRYAAIGCGVLILAYAFLLTLIGESVLSMFGQDYVEALAPALVLVVSRGLGDILIGQPTIVASMDGSARRIALAHAIATALFLTVVLAATALGVVVTVLMMALIQAALMTAIQVAILFSAQARPRGGFSPALSVIRNLAGDCS